MCHVLIIEDEALIALDLQAMLERAGAKTFDFADTEQEAVRAARAHCPDVILSDVQLREGTGPCAVNTIQAEMGPLPVIYITGTPEACDSLDPAVRILIKPINAHNVRAAFSAVAPR